MIEFDSISLSRRLVLQLTFSLPCAAEFLSLGGLLEDGLLSLPVNQWEAVSRFLEHGEVEIDE